MNKETIRNLYGGKIYPSEDIVLTSAKAKEIINQFEEEYSHFKDKLPKEEIEKFEDFRDTIMSYMSEYGIECFSYGLGLGIRMTTETAEHFE